MLGRLIECAQEARSAHARLRGLFLANRALLSDLSLESVLRHIVVEACTLLDARYGALGVLTADAQGLERFIHVGLDEETVERIGALPQGKGVPGALIERPEPIRLRDLTADFRSVGFPEGHPPMKTFLGLPITIKGEVFGNLYLTERRTGDFTESDVEMASALAATAAIAIVNARMFSAVELSEAWTHAATDVAMRLVTSPDEDALRMIAEKMLELADADAVTMTFPTKDDMLVVEVAVGRRADRLQGRSYPLAGTLSEEVLASGEPVRLASTEERPGREVDMRGVLSLGPVMVLPLNGVARTRGTVVVGRLHDRRPFSKTDLEYSAAFAGQAALALELSEVRQDGERMQIYEDRDRIACDLHDHVIQQLFAAGLELQSVAAGVDDARSVRLDGVVRDLNTAIREIRASIFDLRDRPESGWQSTRRRVLATVADCTQGLELAPAVHFSGPVETLIDERMAIDVLAVAREALTNVARHARASSVELFLKASAEWIELRVRDDGDGIGESPRGRGLTLVADLADGRGGSVALTPPPRGSGTSLVWKVPATTPAHFGGS